MLIIINYSLCWNNPCSKTENEYVGAIGSSYASYEVHSYVQYSE